MKKQLTAEQETARAERRANFAALVKRVGAMGELERAKILPALGGVGTCEGRVLSPRNSILCLMQRPDVSLVGGFRQWLKAGRAVRKGEHGMTICVRFGGTSETDSGETVESVYYGTGTVFDIGQTQEIAGVATQQESEAAA